MRLMNRLRSRRAGHRDVDRRAPDRDAAAPLRSADRRRLVGRDALEPRRQRGTALQPPRPASTTTSRSSSTTTSTSSTTSRPASRRGALGARHARRAAATPTPAAWTCGTTWTYPNGKDNWRSLTNGYEYNIQVTGPDHGAHHRHHRHRPEAGHDPPRAASSRCSFGPLGRRLPDDHELRLQLRRDRDDLREDLRRHRLERQRARRQPHGTAYGNIYAEGNDHRQPDDAGTGRRSTTATTIRTVIKQPISFTSFSTSLVDIQRAAQLSGIYLNNASRQYASGKLTFNSDGTVDVNRARRAARPAPTPTCSRTLRRANVPCRCRRTARSTPSRA